MSKLILCPNCKNKVIWAYHFPRIEYDFHCLRCSYNWKKTMQEMPSQYGVFLGHWEGQEMTRLEEGLGGLKMQTNWNFFKGRNIFTAWQYNNLIITKKIDELIYWVAVATQDQKGTWYKTYLRLTCS